MAMPPIPSLTFSDGGASATGEARSGNITFSGVVIGQKYNWTAYLLVVVLVFVLWRVLA